MLKIEVVKMLLENMKPSYDTDKSESYSLNYKAMQLNIQFCGVFCNTYKAKDLALSIDSKRFFRTLVKSIARSLD